MLNNTRFGFPINRHLQTLVARHARLSGIVLGFVAWIVVALLFPRNLMPLPHEALLLTIDLILQGTVWEHLSATLWRTLWGFFGAVLIGGALGILIGITRYGKNFFLPYLVIGLSIPAVAWAAITTVVFGLTIISPVVATIAVTFPYIAINVWQGVESIDQDLVEMSHSFDISYPRLLFRLVLRDTAPMLFTAFRLGLAISWKIVTIAEMFASNNGVGYKIIQTYEFFKFEEAWAWGIVFMIVILVIEYGIFKPLERRMFEYRSDADFKVISR